jgi:hypothetical protein
MTIDTSVDQQLHYAKAKIEFLEKEIQNIALDCLSIQSQANALERLVYKYIDPCNVAAEDQHLVNAVANHMHTS